MFHGQFRSEDKIERALAKGGLLFSNYSVILYGVKRNVKEFKTKMFQNSVRPRGRPRSFDESDALEKATKVFRAKGFDGVTIDDLVAGMGVGRPTLYSIFGDKRTIFLRALRGYAERKGAHAAKALFSRPTLQESLASFLRHAVDAATEEGSAPGCLLLCVAPLVDDAEVRQFLKDAVAGGMALVERRFVDAIEAGEISSDFPVAARASQVLDISRGLTMRAQMGAPRTTLLNDAAEAAELLMLPRRAITKPDS